MLFKKIEGAAAVLLSKGVHRQVDVYERNDALFARWGNGFIALRYSGFGGLGTALPHVNVVHVEGPFAYRTKGFGLVMITSEVTERAA